MLDAITKVLGNSDEKCSEINEVKLESLNIATVAFFANFREDIEFFRDVINIADSPQVMKVVDERLEKAGYDFILSKNRTKYEEKENI
ncbi:hypothetical protein [Streptococcus cuniculi]|uniref:Uncharacterized protein n=1 Tax=Streptococcus cuniculi TaxID=1432788 RepID=A0A4Y9J9G3_9STRE|nr:hypothetical protein [Streptococcus cuniculi]MBF0779368.1 hypothetical protein [Streptococcus cuniculi]TFU96624.1 hypothetical protein E4T82_11800 [Streptococcus cuniculi]